MKKLLRAIAAAALGVSLSAGMAAAQTGSIDTTGPDSLNRITFDGHHRVDVDNDTDIDLDVKNDQDADSGDATVRRNTEAGDAETGNAENNFELSVDAEVDNSGSSAAAWNGSNGGGDLEGSIYKTGPDSRNIIRFDSTSNVDISNDTDFDLDLHNDQDARSGDATVERNTEAGDATTGDATNTSSTTVNLSVSN